MGKGLVFQQQQCYGDDGMWIDTHAQHQQSYGYGYNQDSWGSNNMNMIKIKPSGANYAIESHHGYGNKLGSATHSYSHHQFSNGGADKFDFDSSGHHGGYNFEEYNEYNEERHGDEHRNYGGGDHGFHANPYGHGGYKGVWITKGV
ncbi:PREDICTED: cold and drought-regulated protein CORA-like [Lupinus angustifolius]|uniref:cold and drought-regulated protein CORA-like n=1 Tax=Lupinus angustifolius TaxID=3871 RepID=UPI00092E743D|nr:PREDICTED: cold and drought-regulated protein CORA-like [Lupinus angustifolius]